VAIESRALGTLAYIRASIESSSSMDVPGMAGIAMGVVGLLAAVIVSLPGFTPHWLRIWLVASAIALLLGGASVLHQIAARGRSRYLGPLRKFLLCLCPALFAGAVLTWTLVRTGMTGVVSGVWLLLYGVAVMQAGAFSVRTIPVMGAMFVLAGAVALPMPWTWANVMLAIGFGGLHVGFGAYIAWKHGG